MNRPNGLDVFLQLRKSRKDIEDEKMAAANGEPYDTLERHRNRLLEIAKKEQHNIIEIFEEVVSGENIMDRPDMQRLLREVENSRVDAVLAIDLDRLGRGDMLDQGMIDRAFRSSGTKIITPTEYYDPSDESWELVFGVKSIISRQELKTINKRLYNGRIDSVKEGKHIGKKPPFGYVRDEHLRLQINPDNSWVVEQIFQWTIDGKGRRVIADELNAMGIDPPSGKGKKWSLTSVRNILQNEVYQGDMIWGKQKNIKRNGKYVPTPLPREKWIINENSHEPIVPRETFIKVNDIISSRYVPPTSEPSKLVNAMAGVLRCEVCGYSMWRINTTYKAKNKERAATLVCQNSYCRKQKQQKGASYRLVEQMLINLLEELAKQFSVAHTKKKPKDNIDSLQPLQKLLIDKQSDLVELNSQLENIHEFLERKIYDIDKFMERQTVINDRIKQTKDAISQLEGEIEKEKLRERKSKEFAPAVINVVEAYKNTNDVLTKNRLLKSILEKATYKRDPKSTVPDDFTITLYPKI